MANQFCIYSTEIAATLDPQNANPAPATLVVFDQDPIFGDYDTAGGFRGRGSKIETLGGVVLQDFGVVEKDAQIRIAEENVLVVNMITGIEALFVVIDGEYLFTDGVNCWTVRFARPDGFTYRQNLFFKIREDVDVFSYEILFNVMAKEI